MNQTTEPSLTEPSLSPRAAALEAQLRRLGFGSFRRVGPQGLLARGRGAARMDAPGSSWNLINVIVGEAPAEQVDVVVEDADGAERHRAVFTAGTPLRMIVDAVTAIAGPASDGAPTHDHRDAPAGAAAKAPHRIQQPVRSCPCECSQGRNCGGCGHAGCARRTGLS